MKESDKQAFLDAHTKADLTVAEAKALNDRIEELEMKLENADGYVAGKRDGYNEALERIAELKAENERLRLEGQTALIEAKRIAELEGLLEEAQDGIEFLKEQGYNAALDAVLALPQEDGLILHRNEKVIRVSDIEKLREGTDKG